MTSHYYQLFDHSFRHLLHSYSVSCLSSQIFVLLAILQPFTTHITAFWAALPVRESILFWSQLFSEIIKYQKLLSKQQSLFGNHHNIKKHFFLYFCRKIKLKLKLHFTFYLNHFWEEKNTFKTTQQVFKMLFIRLNFAQNRVLSEQ